MGMGRCGRPVRWTPSLRQHVHELRATAKARQWVENILGRELKAGEQINIEDLVGGRHHLMIENVKRDGRTFDNVSTVHSYREE
jgi:hypothetical protein